MLPWVLLLLLLLLVEAAKWADHVSVWCGPPYKRALCAHNVGRTASSCHIWFEQCGKRCN
jgi:hypothetical protein